MALNESQKSALASQSAPQTDFGVRKVTAIVRLSVLQQVEQHLQAMHVPGISVTRVKGYGEYANLFRFDWVCEHARIEVYCRSEQADAIARCILGCAHTGESGDGIVVVLPVESIYRVRTGELATAEELGGETRDTEPAAREREEH